MHQRGVNRVRGPSTATVYRKHGPSIDQQTNQPSPVQASRRCTFDIPTRPQAGAGLVTSSMSSASDVNSEDGSERALQGLSVRMGEIAEWLVGWWCERLWQGCPTLMSPDPASQLFCLRRYVPRHWRQVRCRKWGGVEWHFP